MNNNKLALILGFITLAWSVEGQAHGEHGEQGFHAPHHAFRPMERPINRRELDLERFHARHPDAKLREGVTGRRKSNAAGTVNVGCYTYNGENQQYEGTLENQPANSTQAQLRTNCFVHFSGCRDGNQPDCFPETIDSSKSKQKIKHRSH